MKVDDVPTYVELRSWFHTQGSYVMSDGSIIIENHMNILEMCIELKEF